MKSSANIQQALQKARQAQQAGRLGEAEQIYRQALLLSPKNAEAIQELGVLLFQSGQKAEALAKFRRAVELDPDSYAPANNLGVALQAAGQIDEAVDVYRKAIQRHPRTAQLLFNLGVTLQAAGRLDEAIPAFEQALALRADYSEACNNLAALYVTKEDYDHAISTYERLISINPNFAPAHCNLGEALRKSGRPQEAIACYRRAMSLDPRLAEAPYDLGLALRSLGRYADAVEAYRTALAVRPDYPAALNNLGNALCCNMRDPDAAVDACRRAMQLRPDYSEPFNNLGNALRQLGRLEEADDAFRRALALAPQDAECHSNLVFSMHYFREDPEPILTEARRWSERHALPLKPFIHPHANTREPDRPLRVGYVSADFRDHPVGRNLIPLISRHDRQAVQVYCYSNSILTDAVTAKFAAAAAGWREIDRIADDAVAETIRADKIDILVDLAGHTAGNRLRLFARKPAPIQVTFGGYPGGTGLETIDYHLTDPYLDPPGQSESHYVEKLHRLPDSFWCYDPESMGVADGPEVAPLPAIAGGHITFGCLNNFSKVTPRTLRLWADVLNHAPGSRMLLLTPPGSARQHVIRVLGEQRVDFVPQQQRRLYLETYHRIDIGLDTLPYNGHTTSLDSIWMGVPVLTLVGKTAVGRAGWSQLSNLGLTELAATDESQFVKLAVDWSSDLTRLSELRTNLRHRFLSSPLANVPRFVSGVESAYREMWRTFLTNAV